MLCSLLGERHEGRDPGLAAMVGSFAPDEEEFAQKQKEQELAAAMALMQNAEVQPETQPVNLLSTAQSQNQVAPEKVTEYGK